MRPSIVRNKRIIVGVLACLLSGASLMRAQTRGGDVPFKIVKLDPALDSIISPDAKLDTLGDKFGLAEGPVWVPEGAGGYLLFSDIASNRIYRWERGKPLSIYMDKAGYTGKDNL